MAVLKYQEGGSWVEVAGRKSLADFDAQYVTTAWGDEQYLPRTSHRGNVSLTFTQTTIPNAGGTSTPVAFAAATSLVNCTQAGNSIRVGVSGWWLCSESHNFAAAADTYGERVFVDLLHTTVSGSTFYRMLNGSSGETKGSNVVLLWMLSGESIAMEAYQSTGASTNINGFLRMKYLGER